MSNFKDVFISYGRRESLGFVGRLHQQLKLKGYDCWFDKVNIPDGDDFTLRINHGIESAHNFIYVMAPRSLSSPYCLIELEYARLLGKRVLPINQMVVFEVDNIPLSSSEISALERFYYQHRLPDPNLKTTQEVLQHSLKVIGKTDWLDAKEEVNMEACTGLTNWAKSYENHWHKHEQTSYLQETKLPVFGKSIDTLESVVERVIAVLKREHNYVTKHTEILANALQWANNQKQSSYLLVGKDRQAAEEWLLQPFTTGERQAPCQPSSLHCEFICESRKNAENLMVDVFVCYSTEDVGIRDKVVNTLSRYGVTTWKHDRDIRKGENDQQAITRGIIEADNFMFFVSPHSVNSAYCQQEYQQALKLNKRVIPLLVAESPTHLAGFEKLPGLASLQYIDFTDNVKHEDYGRDIDEILNLLKQDRQYFEEHKQLLAKAIKWKQYKEKPVFLLRGFNLENAQTWLRVNRERGQYAPTSLHREYILASEAAKGSLSTEVFISYSRKDSDFARQLNNALQEIGKTTWFDQESIASGADFQAEIYKGIVSSDNFLFIISPDAVASPYCKDEVEFAASQNKRMINVLHRSTPTASLPKELADIHWLDFENRAFGEEFTALVQTIEIDQAHAHQHTVLQQRAIEWHEHEKSSDFLLNASAYEKATTWLKEGKSKIPPPTILQKEYIQESEEAKLAAEAKERAVALSLKKRLRNSKIALGIAILFILVAAFFGWKSYKSGEEAKEALSSAQAERENALKSNAMAQKKAGEAEQQKNRATNEKQKAEQALSDLAQKQQELKKEKAIALAAKDTAEVRRIEAEEARLKAEAEKEKAKKALKANKANSVFALVQTQNLIEQNPTLAFNLMAWANKELRGTNKTVKEVLYKAYNDYSHSFYKSFKRDKGWHHTDRITSVSFSPDGSRVLTGSRDNTAKLWDLDGNELQTLKGHTGYVTSVSFSSDGSRVLTGSYDNTAKLWDLDGNELQSFTGHKHWVTSVSFSPDGRRVLTGSLDNTAKLWDLDGNELQSFTGHTDDVNSVSFSPDGSQALTGSDDNTAKLWDLGGNELHTFKGHRYDITSVNFSADGSRVLTGSDDNTAKLWDLDGTELQTFKGHTGRVTSVSFSPDGRRVLTGSEDYTAKLWDLSGNELHTFKGHTDYVSSVSFSPDEKRVLTGSDDNTAKLWDLSGNELQTFKGHKDDVNSVSFSPDGNRVLTGSDDKTAKLWDLEGKELQTFKGHTKPITSVSFSPDRSRVLTGSFDNTAKLWDLAGNELKTFKGHTYEVTSVSFSPDGSRVLTGSSDYTAKLWDLSGAELQNFKGHIIGVTSVSFSPDGSQALTGSKDRTVKLWDLEGNELQTFKGHTGSVTSVSFSPDGSRVLAGSKDYTANLWNLSGNAMQTFKGHTSSVTSVSFSPDGSRVLTGSYDNTAKLWDLDGNELQTFKGHTDYVSSVSFSPDGIRVLTGSYDNTAKLWDLDGNELQTFKGHTNYVTSVSFSPDGSMVLTGSWDNTAKLWDLDGNELKTFKGHIDGVNTASFSPDGSRVLTVGRFDNTATLWDLDGNELQNFKGHTYAIYSVSFPPDGSRLLTGSSDNTAKLWGLDGNELHTFKGHTEGVESVSFSPDGSKVLTGSADKTAKLWDLEGNELQTFKGYTNGFSSVSFSPDGKKVLTGSSDKTAKLWDIKMPLEEYIEKGNYDRLTKAQMREYGLLDDY